MQVGVAVRDITPSSPQWMHGYSSRDHKSVGVSESLTLSCLAVRDGGSTLLLVCCDMIGIQIDACKRLYALLAEATGIAYPNILLSCSHTHFAPTLHPGIFTDPAVGLQLPDTEYVADFEMKLIEAAMESLRKLQDCTLEMARMEVPQVAFNRRTIRKSDGGVTTNYLYPQSTADEYKFQPIDPELTVLRFRSDTGMLAVLTNFGCHPVTGTNRMPNAHDFVSADYPHYLRHTIGRACACPALFTLGAAGDAVPANRLGDCRAQIGSVLGNSMLLAERTFVTEEQPVLEAWATTVNAQTIFTTAPPKISKVEFEAARDAWLALRGEESHSAEDLEKASARYAETSCACGRARQYPDNRYDIPVQFLRVGATTLVALPFEVLSEISLRMKARFPNSVLVSCAGGYQGYLPLAHEYPRGGYEADPDSTHFTSGTADRILETVLAELEAHG